MRSSWKGSLGFGLLTIPVNLAGSVADNDIKTHQHAPDGSRIRYKRVAESTGEEVAYKDIKTGYECPDGNVVFLTDEDFEAAYGKVSREASILLFTDSVNIPDLAKSKPFFIQPQKGSEKAYALLARALAKTGKVAVVQFGMRQRKRLGAVSPTADGYLVLEQLEWHDDIRKPDFQAPSDEISAAEEDMAVNLIESMSKDYRHEDWKDDSQAKLDEMISRRIEQGQVTRGFASKGGNPAPADLSEILKASVEASKSEIKTVTKTARRKASA